MEVMNNEGAGQTVWMRRLVYTFVIHMICNKVGSREFAPGPVP